MYDMATDINSLICIRPSIQSLNCNKIISGSYLTKASVASGVTKALIRGDMVSNTLGYYISYICKPYLPLVTTLGKVVH